MADGEAWKARIKREKITEWQLWGIAKEGVLRVRFVGGQRGDSGEICVLCEMNVWV